MTKTITCDKCNGRGYFTFEQSGDCYAGVTVLRCEVCQGKRVVEVPVTNADHIRSMTDEELAVFLECFGGCHYCSEYKTAIRDGHGIINCDGDCEQHISDWLKQPFKEAI